jgi:hypothetical protein
MRRTFAYLPFPGKIRSSFCGSLSAVLALTLGATALKAQDATPNPPLLQGESRSAAVVPAFVPVAAASDSNPLPQPAGPAVEEAANALPEAPMPQIGNPQPVNPGARGQAPIAAVREKYIPAGWQAQRLNVAGKIRMGATDLYSFENFGAIVLSAGYEQIFNSEPNYGKGAGAFGQRVGAAAVREASQGVFTDMVFGSLLREDTRYYQEGPGRNPVHRTLYAITRPFVTRTDGGAETINGALLLGYAAAAAITPAYYPAENRNFHDTLSTYGGSIGGAALGFFVSEFSTDVLQALHLKHAP